MKLFWLHIIVEEREDRVRECIRTRTRVTGKQVMETYGQARSWKKVYRNICYNISLKKDEDWKLLLFLDDK